MKGSLSDKLVANVSEDVNWDTDVVGDERLVVKEHERVEALEEGQKAGEKEGKVGGPGLEGGFVRESVSGDSLGFHSLLLSE